MKTLFCALILATFGTAAAMADSLTITFAPANQPIVAGQTVAFFADITNDTTGTIFLNGDTINLQGASFTIDDLFFANAPISLAPGSSSGSLELFDVTASNPLLDAPGTFAGSYTLVGGADGNAQDNLGTGTFSVETGGLVNPVPEPSTLWLLLSGLPATVLPLTRKLRSQR